MHVSPGPSRQEHVIGIVGGMGPFAHLEFERQLLACVPNATRDLDYPQWLLSSVPTPSMTRHLSADGPSPVPALRESLRRLHPVAGFAVVACNTMHAFWDEFAPRSPLPLLNLVDETLRFLQKHLTPGARVGILGITAMLQSRLYPRAAAAIAPDLQWLSLLDLDPKGDLQETLTMDPLFGPSQALGSWAGGGIKTGEHQDLSGRSHRDQLLLAVQHLAEAGATTIVAGCTEIPVALGPRPLPGVQLIDPMQLAAQASVAMAYGLRSLPENQGARIEVGV